MQNQFTAIIHKAAEGGFWAICAEVPEANGQGESREECLEDLAAAVELVLEARRESAITSAEDPVEYELLTVGRE